MADAADGAAGAEQIDPASPVAGESQEQEQQPGNESGSETGAEQTSQEQQGEAGAAAEAGEATGDKKRTPWYQHRINELTRERKAAEERERLEAGRRTEVEQELAKLKQGGDPKPGEAVASKDEIDRRVAERVVAEKRVLEFNERCNKVYEAGKKDFADFEKTLTNFSMLGEIPPHFIDAATVIDGGHKVLHHLANNLDLAAELLTLPPVQLGARMAELKSQLDRPNPKPVSRTPKPVTPIDGSGGGLDGDYSKLSTEQFMERRNREAPIKR